MQEEEDWRRRFGGGGLEEEDWRRIGGRGFEEEEDCKRSRRIGGRIA